MTVIASGKFMVRVPRATFSAFMAAASAPLHAAATTATTRPLFGATHSAGVTFSAHLPSADQTDWLLHQPHPTGLHPWDIAHQIAQGKQPGSAQFAAAPSVYVEPDMLSTRKIAVPPAAASASADEAPWPAYASLNTHYDPKPPAIFSPAWHLDVGFGNFAEAWTYNRGAGIRIAHLDTGYSPDHMSTPRGMQFNQGYNFSEDNTNTVDPYQQGALYMPGHGTATLALLAGKTVDIQYMAGPIFNDDIGGAPDASVVPVRIGPSVIHLYSAAMAQGLDYALAPREGGRCDVVSLSHGGLPSKAWAEAVNRLYDAGVVVVAASGDSFYFEVIDVATHFTVYPSAFYRVITATGATYTKGPYITNDFGTMQGCWGPDKVMRKAIAAYTPNVPWMANHDDPHGWDMDGGGTSASTPQIAAACALWLKQYGGQFPLGWRRVEACRHALFESAANRGQNVSQIGVGLLDAGAMLRPATLAKVLQALQTNQLPYAPPDDVSFPFLRLLFGLPPPGAGVDEMYDTEAAQIFFRSRNADLAAAVAANPDGDPAVAPLSAARRKALRDAFIAEPSISSTLKAYLQTQAVQNP
jgi:subtilisin family serine protease